MKYKANFSKNRIEDDITLVHLRSQRSIRLIKENDGSFDVEYADGTKALVIKLINGQCPHAFTVFGEGYDGKYYISCDMGGSCHFRREITGDEIQRFKKA